MRMLPTFFLAAGLAASVVSSGAAGAAEYPERPVTIVVPAPPGGLTDTLSRLYAANFQERFGQPFVIQNKPGGSLMIGTNAVAKSEPDGYTILVVIGAHAQNLHLQKAIPYDSVKDFSPVARINLSPMIMTVRKELGVKNLDEFKEAVKSGQLSYGSYGVGTTPHILGRVLETRLNSPMLHVPFKGEAPVMNDILAGQVTTSFISTITALPHIQAGTAVPLAVTGTERLAQLPDVPTLAEAGLPGFEMNGWTGFLVPAGTPDDIVAKLSDAFVEATESPAIRERLVSTGLVPAPMGHQEFGVFLDGQYKRWGDTIKEVGVTLE